MKDSITVVATTTLVTVRVFPFVTYKLLCSCSGMLQAEIKPWRGLQAAASRLVSMPGATKPRKFSTRETSIALTNNGRPAREERRDESRRRRHECPRHASLARPPDRACVGTGLFQHPHNLVNGSHPYKGRLADLQTTFARG